MSHLHDRRQRDVGRFGAELLIRRFLPGIVGHEARKSDERPGLLVPKQIDRAGALNSISGP